mmetsp:Transcript_12970/g.25154  ORF Transcript_12970/g.25154 Transcript_12970/m.25154 type:complete len:353 (-) Transcript_12970:532-1590(-)
MSPFQNDPGNNYGNYGDNDSSSSTPSSSSSSSSDTSELSADAVKIAVLAALAVGVLIAAGIFVYYYKFHKQKPAKRDGTPIVVDGEVWHGPDGNNHENNNQSIPQANWVDPDAYNGRVDATAVPVAREHPASVDRPLDACVVPVSRESSVRSQRSASTAAASSSTSFRASQESAVEMSSTNSTSSNSVENSSVSVVVEDTSDDKPEDAVGPTDMCMSATDFQEVLKQYHERQSLPLSDEDLGKMIHTFAGNKDSRVRLDEELAARYGRSLTEFYESEHELSSPKAELRAVLASCGAEEALSLLEARGIDSVAALQDAAPTTLREAISDPSLFESVGNAQKQIASPSNAIRGQ